MLQWGVRRKWDLSLTFWRQPRSGHRLCPLPLTPSTSTHSHLLPHPMVPAFFLVVRNGCRWRCLVVPWNRFWSLGSRLLIHAWSQAFRVNRTIVALIPIQSTSRSGSTSPRWSHLLCKRPHFGHTRPEVHGCCSICRFGKSPAVHNSKSTIWAW